jgi:Ni,Fe-hydrogenase I cytochrome b subunit
MEEEKSVQSPSSLFNEKHALSIRIWHWIFFIAISSTLIIVLLASTFFRTRANIPMIQEQIQLTGGVITIDQARGVAHEFNDKLWNIHKIIGYVISFLLLSRIVIELSLSREERLRNKIKGALKYPFGNGIQRNDRRHYLIVKYGYFIFYCIILVMAVTGLGLAFEDVPFLKTYHRLIKSIHSFTQYLIYFYILTHLIGVIRADLTNNKGIVSRMINDGES